MLPRAEVRLHQARGPWLSRATRPRTDCSTDRPLRARKSQSVKHKLLRPAKCHAEEISRSPRAREPNRSPIWLTQD